MNNAEFIFSFLKKKGCSKVFSIVGGHAMHLNAAQHKIYNKDVIYFHNEQSLSLAADSYSRIVCKPSIVSVTSGPAALNCLNGVLGAYIDNIPLIIISGQPRTSLCANKINKNLRQYGDQEFSRITDVVNKIVKNTKQLNINSNIEYEISKIYDQAISGRPGPIWVDVPIDVQKHKFIKKNKKNLPFKSKNKKKNNLNLNTKIKLIFKKLKVSKRPIIYAGTDINAFNCKKIFQKLVTKIKIPVVTEWNAHDLAEGKSNLYVGRPGLRGDRKGNIVVYKSDLIISIGSNLSVRQVGDVKNMFSPNSYKIMINVDKNEINKPNLKINLPIKSDIKYFIEEFNKHVKKNIKSHSDWIKWCNSLDEKLKPYDKYIDTSKINPYNAIDIVYKKLPKNKVTVVGNGFSVVGSFQKALIRKDDIIFQNVGCASMGYDIPASIGASFATQKLKSKKKIFCVTGDGSFQFNIQELQTINHHNLKINFIIFNNEGYSSMKQSQNNFINNIGLHGVDKKTGISFPDLSKIAKVYNYKYFRASNSVKLNSILNNINFNKNNIIEIFVDPKQGFSPKVSSKINEFGGFEVDELYNMSPKIPATKLSNIMKLPKNLI